MEPTAKEIGYAESVDGRNLIALTAFERTPRLAELKVSYRRPRNRRTKSGNTQQGPIAIVDSGSCEAYLRQIWNKDTIEFREEFIVLCLNGVSSALEA